MSMTGKPKKFFRLARLEKWVLVEACLYLTLSCVVIKLIPFRWISSYFGQHMSISSDDEVNGVDEKVVSVVRQSVLRAQYHLPWKSVCLPVAMTAKFMLGRRGIKTTLYMGVKKGELGKLSAHAWLRAGELIVMGELEKEDFTVVASFA